MKRNQIIYKLAFVFSLIAIIYALISKIFDLSIESFTSPILFSLTMIFVFSIILFRALGFIRFGIEKKQKTFVYLSILYLFIFFITEIILDLSYFMIHPDYLFNNYAVVLFLTLLFFEVFDIILGLYLIKLSKYFHILKFIGIIWIIRGIMGVYFFTMPLIFPQEYFITLDSLLKLIIGGIYILFEVSEVLFEFADYILISIFFYQVLKKSKKKD